MSPLPITPAGLLPGTITKLVRNVLHEIIMLPERTRGARFPDGKHRGKDISNAQHDTHVQNNNMEYMLNHLINYVRPI